MAIPTPRPRQPAVPAPPPSDPTIVTGQQPAHPATHAPPPTRPTRFMAPGGDSDVHQGQTWGDFVLGTLLGKGGMGSVYLGRQVSLDRPVAIKVLPAHLGGNEQFRKRFMLEARAVAQISSPHVVQVYAAGEHEGHHYFAMEFVEGDDLSRRLRHGFTPTAPQSLDLVTQAARGLAAAGDLGIVHRDIKPGNMMVTHKNLVKLMDFGLVRLARSEDTGLTRAGTIMGTVSYFSPEQGRGDTCDQRTDIYALGVVFYELLTGTLPFTGDDATAIIYQHIHVAPKAPREINPAVPDDFQAVVLKCLQKDPAHRYQNAQELIADLEDLHQGNAPRTAFLDARRLRVGATMVRGDAFQREKARRQALLGVLGAAVVTIGGGVWWFRYQPPAPPAVAPLVQAPPVVAPTAPAPALPVAAVAAAPAEPAPPRSAEPPAITPIAAAPVSDGSAALATARLHLDAERLGDCRTLVDANRAAHPASAEWATLAHDLDRAEGAAAMGSANDACNRGDDAEAARLLANARRHGPDDAAMAALAQRLAQRDEEHRQRARQLEEARTLTSEGRFAEAEDLLNRLKTDHADDTAVEAALRTARARRHEAEARTRAVAELLDKADQALARKDYDNAFTAYTTALKDDAGSLRAKAGLEAVDHAKQQIVELRTRFNRALAERDLGAAATQLAALAALAPGSPDVAMADKKLADARLVEELARKAAAEREALLAAQAQAVATTIDNPALPLAQGQESLARFLAIAGGARPEQPFLERKLDDRRQREQVVALLAGLDRSVATRDGAGIRRRVADAAFAADLERLAAYTGLVFESRLGDFTRNQRSASATVRIRHALQVFPERTLTYRYDLRQTDQGWVIAAAAQWAPEKL